MEERIPKKINDYFEGCKVFKYNNGFDDKIFHAFEDIQTYFEMLNLLDGGKNSAGSVIKAVKVYRSVTGAGLIEARDFIYDIRVRELQSFRGNLEYEIRNSYPECFL